MKLAEIFCDNMVLQREKDIAVFGTGAGKGCIEFCGQITEFESKDNKFCVYLSPQKAGGPYNMKVNLEGNSFVIKNILIGDVYIAAGQSNMEWLLKNTVDIELEQNDNIRLFTEPNNADDELNITYDMKGWLVNDSQNALNFSAIGYGFASELYKETQVPIGIISCNKGASRVDAWTAPEIVKAEDYQKMLAVKHNDFNAFKFNQNSWLYLNKLLKIVPFTVSGVLWYQGESNRGLEESAYYGELLKLMIENWRNLWNDNLAFYCVQLMPYFESEKYADWAAIRKNQEWASKNIDQVYMVTLQDTNEETQIHPTKKGRVATALANAVLCTKFDKGIEYSGPVYDGIEKLANGVKITFTHADGLCIKGNSLRDTYVFDAKNTSHKVNAKIDNNTLVINWNSEVNPKRITMGYANSPKHNLYNNSGYLASPFSIDLF